jgi:CDP-diacylglycerol--glycerol-3-phosphate 3-phosphatidyltransferase
LNDSAENRQPANLTDFLRKTFSKFLEPVGHFFNRLGIKPNTMTLIGVMGNIAAAVLIALGHISWGGLLVLLMGPVDAIDGVMARQRGRVTRFGGFVDSVADRYSELFILGGLLIFYVNRGETLPVILAYLAAAGSVLVSYIRARGEAAGYQVKAGLLTRVERYLILAPCLIINRPLIALWALAVLANLTALQRIWLVRTKAKTENDIL